MVRSREGEQRARVTMQRQGEREQAPWEKRWWHLSHRAFACAPDAQVALERERQQLPAWLVVQTAVVATPKYQRVGRPARTHRPPSRCGTSRPGSTSTPTPSSARCDASRLSWWLPMSWRRLRYPTWS